MEDLDALLADLQHQTQLNATPQTQTFNLTAEYHIEKSSPIYQNQHVLQEMTKPQTTPAHDISNNLSELDSLLEDLNSARYNDDKRGNNGCINGPAPPRKEVNNSANINGVHNVQPNTIIANNRLCSQTKEPIWEGVSPQPVPSASSATKELDDLMASLSDFKVNQPAISTESAYAKPQKPKKQQVEGSAHTDQLDSMLGTLHSDMSKQGVVTTAKGHCNACNKPIVGQVITALGKTWHPEHFTCTKCKEELGAKSFFEREGRPYCEKDYHNMFSPRCAYCNGAILDKCVTALDKTWHPDHFFCAQCGKQFGEGGFHEKEGKAYCKDDFLELFALKCGGCNRPITDNYISALNAQWHPNCFVCRDCRQAFEGGSFFDHEGQPYCETHFHAKRGSLCAGCHKPISGRCVTALQRKFHPEHFVCSFCLKQLNKGTFKEQNDKPYCHPCFEKLFS